MLDSKASTPQPPPIAGKIDVAPVVIADIEARVAAGEREIRNVATDPQRALGTVGPLPRVD